MAGSPLKGSTHNQPLIQAAKVSVCDSVGPGPTGKTLISRRLGEVDRERVICPRPASTSLGPVSTHL